MKNRLSVWLRVMATAILLLATLSLNVVQAAPPRQDPRGDGSSGSPGGGGAVEGDHGEKHPAEARCASLVGQVINWGFGGEGGVTTELKTGSWQVSTISASDGNYGFGGLGIGVAVLHVALTPEQASRLKPLVQDAGVYLNCDFPTIANLALYSGPAIEPPATIQMTAPSRVAPGQQVPLSLTIENHLPTEITNVIVTDLMPQGLVAVSVAASAVDPKNLKIIDGGPDGQLVVVYLDKLAAGDKANITLTVTPAADVSLNTRVTNTATLFYRESAADQATVEMIIGPGSAPVVAATATPASTGPTATPVATLQLAAEATATPVSPPTPLPTATPAAESESGAEFVPPGGLPTTGEDFVPPDALPVTGEDNAMIPTTLPETGWGIILPLTALGLLGLAVLSHYLRSPYNDNQ